MHLTIGVTGHRDLLADEVPALKKIVRDFFLQLENDFPDLDLQLITPLAEGSDRLVADVALELGFELIVPLPMPQADYEKDFSSAEAVDAFRSSLKKARVIHLRTLPENNGQVVTAANHDRQYAQMGIFISNHSQVLLSLWDGKTSDAVGGTASVVNYHLTAVMPGFAVAEESPNLLADNENDLAYHIVCSRDRPDGRPRKDLKPLQTMWITAHYGLETGDSMPLEYQIMLHRLQEYGRDWVKYQSAIDREGADLLVEGGQAEGAAEGAAARGLEVDDAALHLGHQHRHRWFRRPGRPHCSNRLRHRVYTRADAQGIPGPHADPGRMRGGRGYCRHFQCPHCRLDVCAGGCSGRIWSGHF